MAQHTLILPLDDVVTKVLLKNFGKPTNPTKQDQVSSYLQDLFEKLDGVVRSISVSHKEIKVVWEQNPNGKSPFEPLLEMLNHGQYLEAGLVLELLLAGDPEDETALYNLGMVYSDLGVLDRAINYLRRLATSYPNNINGRVALGVALMRNGENQAAVSELESAIEIDPNNPWAQRNLGGCLASTGQPEQAAEHIRKATELAPTDILAWYGLGQVLENLNDQNGASAAYQKVLDIDEFGDIAERARLGLNRISEKSFRSAMPGMERMDAVMYCLSAIEKFENMTADQVRQVGFEIAILGTKGLDINDPTQKYQIRNMPGRFSGLHLLCLQYVAFKQIAPDLDIGMDLSKEYRAALSLHNRKNSEKP